MSQEHKREWPSAVPEGESIEIGPDDYLQESAQDWVPEAALALGAAKLGVDYMRVKLDRERLELDRERLDFERHHTQRDADPHDPKD